MVVGRTVDAGEVKVLGSKMGIVVSVCRRRMLVFVAVVAVVGRYTDTPAPTSSPLAHRSLRHSPQYHPPRPPAEVSSLDAQSPPESPGPQGCMPKAHKQMLLLELELAGCRDREELVGSRVGRVCRRRLFQVFGLPGL